MAKTNTVYTAVIKGIRPFVMHNSRLADPLDDYTKALQHATKKKNKSDEDHIEIGRIEFVGGMYHDGKLGPYVPADNLQAMIEKGAAKRKLGPVCKAHVGVLEPTSGAAGYALDYKGPRDIKALWEDKNFVLRKGARVKQARVIRTRARFPVGWSVEFQVEVLAGGMSQAQLEEAIIDGGLYHGLGDWRPRYGRFELVSIK
jgi:hypothetical protein